MLINKLNAAVLISVCAALLALSACGDEPVETPEFSDLQIVCAQSSSSDEGLIVERVQVQVSDPNRELLSVKGSINSVLITLEDPDADLIFTWSPPASEAPMSCKGDFVVSLEATEAGGSSTQFYEIVSK